MQINKREWPLLSMCGIKQRVDTRPDYQRPAVVAFAEAASDRHHPSRL